MTSRTLAITLACSLAAFAIAFAHADPAGRIAGWSGGTADIFTYGHDDPIGRIHGDGTVTFELPVPPANGQTVADTFDRCRSSALTIDNGDAEVTPTMLYVEHDGAELGLVSASSPEMAEWSLSFGQSPLVEGSHLRWLYVAGAASVTGDCVERMLTPSGELDFRNEWQLQLAPGWNLIRSTFAEVIEHADGSRHETHTRHDALQTMPDDAHWYLETR